MKETNEGISRREFLAGAAAVGVSSVLEAKAWSAPAAKQDRPYVLHFAHPASEWRNALPVGNGRLGAMVFGVPGLDRLQLNEESIWDGEPGRDRNNPKAKPAILRIRELLFQGNIDEAETLAKNDVLSLPLGLPCYQTLGDLHLDFSAMGLTANETVKDYRLELDLDTAVATTTFSFQGCRYKREVFTSAPDQVVVMRLTADKPGRLSLAATLDRPANYTVEGADGNCLVMRGQALPAGPPKAGIREHQAGVRFCAILRAVSEQGHTSIADANGIPVLKIESADAITFMIDCATSYRYPAKAGNVAGVDADLLVGDQVAMRAAAWKNVSNAAAMPYDTLLARHVTDHRQYFRRVDFSLGSDAKADVPTDLRIKAIKGGDEDVHLLPIYFQFGRYLLIGSSRPGTLAANLQGIWNESIDPPWGSKYTVNINAEMNYWFAEAANLSECHLPLFDLLASTHSQGEVTAREMYGARGSVVHHNTDIWGDSVPIDSLGGGLWPMGASWVSLHGWTHYQFTGDYRFLLERVYPELRMNAVFLLDYMVQDPASGKLVTGPSCSPENMFIGPDGKPHHLCMGPTMDIALARAIFARMLEAAEVLGNDVNGDLELHTRVRAAWQQLPSYHLTSDGRLAEWPQDWKEREPGHRHISHLLGLFPEDQITVDGTPELARAARKAVDHRLAHGGGSTGWSRSWIINCLARLRDGDACQESIQELLQYSTLGNLFDLCGRADTAAYQIDGNFGASNGMIEMLLQSQGETPLTPKARRQDTTATLQLVPALPKAWREGSVRGLRGRGGVEVDIAWKDGALRQVVLRCARSGSFEIQFPKKSKLISVIDPHKGTKQASKTGTLTIDAIAGEQYTLQFR